MEAPTPEALATGRLAAFDAKRLSACLELTKPRVTAMVVLTTLAGFLMASREAFDLILLLHTLAATALIAGGTAALNQVLESDADAKMVRTATRPLPSGRLDPGTAWLFATVLVVAGALYLGFAANALTALLGVATSILYLLVYTPLKRKTHWCTAVGAIPGAIPPLMGWAAVRNELDWQAFSLFAVLLLWQFPHFLAIAWMYREDYQRGGFRMLPIVDAHGERTTRHILAYAVGLVAAATLPYLLGLSGWVYAASGVLLGAYLLASSLRLRRARSVPAATRLMRATVTYLPLLLLLLVLDKV